MNTFKAILKRQLRWAAIIVGFGVVYFLIFPEQNPFLVGRELPFEQGATTDLTVIVTGLDGRQGQIVLLVYDSEENFLRAPFRQKTIGLSGHDSLSAVFSALPEGRYALAGFHDENGSSSLDTTLLGSLDEQLVFSLGATSPIGAPMFDDASFRLEGERLALAMAFADQER